MNNLSPLFKFTILTIYRSTITKICAVTFVWKLVPFTENMKFKKNLNNECKQSKSLRSNHVWLKFPENVLSQYHNITSIQISVLHTISTALVLPESTSTWEEFPNLELNADRDHIYLKNID
jgi:hypothetical protein